MKSSCKIDKFADANNKAEGHIIEDLGGIDQAGVDMLSLIKEYKLPNEFPQKCYRRSLIYKARNKRRRHKK